MLRMRTWKLNMAYKLQGLMSIGNKMSYSLINLLREPFDPVIPEGHRQLYNPPLIGHKVVLAAFIAQQYTCNKHAFS